MTPHRSRDLGFGEESAFACKNCVDAGRVYSPPDGWEGAGRGWVVHDISKWVELAKENVKIVLGDLERTTELRPNVTVDTYKNGVRIAYGGTGTSPSVWATSNPDALAETADYLQEHVAEDQWSPWPVCAVHPVGLHSEVHDGIAVWWCRFGLHPVAPVGRLGVTST